MGDGTTLGDDILSVQVAGRPNSQSSDDFPLDLEIDDELKETLRAAESQTWPAQPVQATVVDIEDSIVMSPFHAFRKKGYLSVSDLVGTVWCEVQRPAVITTTAGKEIVVDKVKVEGKERILRRGERLEREIHPEEIVVQTTTREDVWGLRLLNMLSAFEALLTLGKCRELPVAGLVRGKLVMGIIDEVTRKPIDSKAPRDTRAARQTALTAFFSPTKARLPTRTHRLYVSDSKTRASGTLPRESDTLAGRLQVMLYKELLDCVLRAGAQSRTEGIDVSSDSLDVLPSSHAFSWAKLFDHLGLDEAAPFSDHFQSQSRPVVTGNALRWGAGDARSLADMVVVLERYIAALGLGPGPQDGLTEDRLELVYRRAGAQKGSDRKKRRKNGGRRGPDKGETSISEQEDKLVQLAIEASLRDAKSAGVPNVEAMSAEATSEVAEALAPSAEPLAVDTELGDRVVAPAESNRRGPTARTSLSRPSTRQSHYWGSDSSDAEREEDELAWAVEMSLDTGAAAAEPTSVPVRSPQKAAASLPPSQASAERLSSPPSSPESPPGTAAGSIIGRSRFTHDRAALAAHLDSVLGYWMGERAPRGVDVAEASRCAWCEFEDGCEWR